MNAGIAVQWRQGPEPDIAYYRVRWHNDSYTQSGYDDAFGAANTFFAIDGLNNGTLYWVTVQAWDASDNFSTQTGELGIIPQVNADITDPALTLLWPVPVRGLHHHRGGRLGGRRGHRHRRQPEPGLGLQRDQRLHRHHLGPGGQRLYLHRALGAAHRRHRQPT